MNNQDSLILTSLLSACQKISSNILWLSMCLLVTCLVLGVLVLIYHLRRRRRWGWSVWRQSGEQQELHTPEESQVGRADSTTLWTRPSSI